MDGLVLGVDIGASKLRAALADGSNIVAELTEPTRQGSSRAVVGQMVGVAGRLTSQVGRGGADIRSTIGAVGISVPTYVDRAAELLGLGPGVPGLAGADAVRLLKVAFGVPIAIDNDANMAAIAEGDFGAAVGVDNYVVMLIGTGIGMGIVMDGKLRRGWRGRAGEIGRLPLALDRSTLDANAPSDFEAVVAGSAIRLRVKQAAWVERSNDRTSTLSTAGSFEDVVAAAQAGDPAAQRVIQEEARLIATGIAAVVAVLDPQLIALCGELGSMPALIEPVREEVDALVSQPPDIVTSGLGNRGELLGAIVAARDAMAAASAPVRA